MIPAVSVFDYTNPRQFLLDYFSKSQEKLPDASVRKWAKQMGLPSHSLLVMILQGKRPLKMRHCEFLNKGLEITPQEQLYFQALIQKESAKSLKEKDLCQ